ncbi:hypothetical protein [Polyangium spumosum]|uniref:Uncharacterized protein n=1 Tax=Polyangium spumosum TaxID=889282 RepID=A0A6N7Q044_9BACT|nr:hypothetical protein [Polyangium spumosum]MRG94321.1 hypothetical protein [Polyangium spumosum]
MLIHIDGSAVADAIAGNERSHGSIENLLLAHHGGVHIVSFDLRDAESMRAVDWSPRARRVLNRFIEEHYAQIAGLRSDVAWHLELGLGPDFDGKARSLPDGRSAIRASLHDFESLDAVARSILLGENKTDAELFELLGLMRRAMRGWEHLDMLCTLRGGGGSQLGREFAALPSRGTIVLAVADSDKRHRDGGHGESYHGLEKEAAKRPAYQRARLLPRRTAEAVVPLSVYREVFGAKNGDHRVRAVERLEVLVSSASGECIQYAHLKQGITLYQVEHPRTADEGIYWRDVAQKAERDRCTKPENKCVKRDECKCFVVDKLGDGALVDVIAWMKTVPREKDLAKRFNFAEDHDLRALADEVLSWGLALRPVRT